MVAINSLRIGEDVIVIKAESDNYNRIGEVCKIRNDEPVNISVSFDGEIYSYFPEDLKLA